MTLPKWAQEIRTRLDAATPGPWELEQQGGPRTVNWAYAAAIVSRAHDVIRADDYCLDSTKQNFDLVINAPTDLARLLGALETCVTVLAKIDAQTNWCTDKTCIRSGCAAEAQIWARQALVDIKNISEIEGEAK